MSPVKPSDFQALIVSVGGNLCAAFLKLLLQSPVKVYQLVNYMFTSTGAINDLFLRDIIPPGTLMFSASPNAPTGYLLCNGAAVSRTEYATLFTAIGTVWGVGDNSTTFNIPDYRGRIPLGVGTTTGLKDNADADIAGSTFALGGKDGEENVVLVTGELPEHEHQMFIPGDDTEGNNDLNNSQHVFEAGFYGTERSYDIARDADDGTVQPTVGPTGPVGNGTGHNNLPPFSVCFVYCKT